MLAAGWFFWLAGLLPGRSSIVLSTNSLNFLLLDIESVDTVQ